MLKKLLFSVMSVLLLCFTLFSCKGDPGAAGDKGATGPAGDSLVVMAFQDGVYPSDAYTGTDDTEIVSNNPARNDGVCQTIYVTNTNCPYGSVRILLRFNVSSIVPSNVIVKKAYLELTIIDSALPASFVVYELARAFEEGNSCNATGVASWISATASTPWTNQGGDYNSTPISDIYNVPSTTLPTKAVLELNTNTVQKWISNPSENFGMLIMESPESGTANCCGVGFASSEEANASYRPKLIIYYSLP